MNYGDYKGSKFAQNGIKTIFTSWFFFVIFCEQLLRAKHVHHLYICVQVICPDGTFEYYLHILIISPRRGPLCPLFLLLVEGGGGL